MPRVTARQKRLRHSPAEIAERAGYGPKITLKGGYLTLRWKKEQVVEALDSADMTLDQIVMTHLAPRLGATKRVQIRHRGKITASFKQPDWNVQLRTLKLVLQLHGALPEE